MEIEWTQWLIATFEGTVIQQIFGCESNQAAAWQKTESLIQANLNMEKSTMLVRISRDENNCPEDTSL